MSNITNRAMNIGFTLTQIWYHSQTTNSIRNQMFIGDGLSYAFTLMGEDNETTKSIKQEKPICITFDIRWISQLNIVYYHNLVKKGLNK